MKIFLKIYFSLLALLAFPLIALAVTSPLNQGGTGWATSTLGDTFTGTSSPLQYTRIPIGPTGYIYQSNGTQPNWVATSTLGIISTGGNSAWLIGPSLIYNATTTDSVLIGTTTPTTAKLFVQGSGSKLPLRVASSTGSTLFTIDTFGTTTIANLGTGVVRSSSGSLFNGLVSLTTDVTGTLPIANGGTNQTSFTPTNMLYFTGAAVASVPTMQYISATNLLLMNNDAAAGPFGLIETSATSSAILGNLVQSGGVTTYSTSSNITGAQFCSGGLFVVPSTTLVNVALKFPDLNTIAGSSCGSSIMSSGFSQQFLVNQSTSSVVTLAASGTGETLLYAPGFGATLQPGQAQFSQGQFVNTTNITGATSTGTTFNAYLSGYQARATNPTMQGQFLIASTTATGGLPEWVVGNIIAGSNITVTTSTAGQITIAVTGAPTGSGTIGFNSNWVSNTAVGTGKLIDNGTVLGMNATSSIIGFNIQGTTGSNTIFNVASSTGISVLRINPDGSIGIGTTTTTSTLSVQGTSTQPTLTILNVASSSGASILMVAANSRVGVGSSSPAALFTVDSNTSNATTTMLLDSIGTKGFCLKIKDADGTGYTYVVANNGVLTASTGSCE